MIRKRLERIASLSQQIMTRLDSGAKTGAVLPQIRHLAQLAGDSETEAWANLEIYGAFDVPASSLSKADPSVRPALSTFLRLRKAPDYDRIDMEDLLYRPSQSAQQARKSDKAFYGPISQLEAPADAASVGAVDDPGLAEEVVKTRLYLAAASAVAQRVRDYAYDYAGQSLESALRRLENIELLGPDYPVAITSLDALESGVGQELAAALDDLRSTNPASWSGAVLICRSVVLKLGRQLWRAGSVQYRSGLDGKTLDVGPEKEKNRLYAYIDQHHRSAVEDSTRRSLEEAHDLVYPVYQTGSKGKRGSEVTYQEAQDCVVNTFRLVEVLRQSTQLKPLECGDDTAAGTPPGS